MSTSRFSTEELGILKEAVTLLDKYKFSDTFGDTAGALQKVIDIIELSSTDEDIEKTNFIHPEKIPYFKGSEYLRELIQSIRNKKVVRLYYHPFYEDKPYFVEVHPYLLKEYRNRWYLIGLNDFKDQMRTYALDRIRDIDTSDVPFKKHEFDAGAYFKYTIGIIAPDGMPPQIRLAVQKTQAQYIITQPWHASQNIEKETEEEIIFSFKLHPTYEFVSLLLSCGKDIRVLEPVSLKEEMISHLKAMIEMYGKS